VLGIERITILFAPRFLSECCKIRLEFQDISVVSVYCVVLFFSALGVFVSLYLTFSFSSFLTTTYYSGLGE